MSTSAVSGKTVSTFFLSNTAPPLTCALRIADNGLGIPASQVPRIFDSAFRAHAARDGELGTDGLGMGLTIVRDCLRILGGEVEVSSVEGEGTAFVVRLVERRPGG